MRGSADRNRSTLVTVPTPRGRVDVMHQEMRGVRNGSGWRTFWFARRAGKQDWVQADTPKEAIRKATLPAPKKRAAWLGQAAADARKQVEEPTSPDREPTPAKDAEARSQADPSPTVVEVLRFEDLPVGELASRRAVVRFSDGSEGEALRWYSEEILICEGDLIGKMRAELRSRHFLRDRDWLQS